MSALTSSQQKHLRALAHHLQPVVLIGQKGITPGLLEEVKRALEDHELIKVRFTDHKEQRRELSAEIAGACEAEVAGIIGNHLILYRPQPDADKRRIDLPAARR